MCANIVRVFDLQTPVTVADGVYRDILLELGVNDGNTAADGQTVIHAEGQRGRQADRAELCLYGRVATDEIIAVVHTTAHRARDRQAEAHAVRILVHHEEARYRRDDTGIAAVLAAARGHVGIELDAGDDDLHAGEQLVFF